MTPRRVFLVSDGTGITAEVLSHSLLTQFPSVEFDITKVPYINTAERAQKTARRINEACDADGVEPLVFITFADDVVHDIVVDSRGVFFDFFDTFIGSLEHVLGVRSSHTRGRTHGVLDTEQYRSRISAIDYTMQCDDGVNIVDYGEADLVLVGVSRSGKTPTCLYMALHFGLRAANYPLVEDDLDRSRLPEALVSSRNKLFGLTIDPIRLQQIRQERRPNSRYSRLAQCRTEVASAEALFRNEHVPYLDATSMSIEEISTTIMDQRGLYRTFF
ncbi:MAG: regulator of PEP synthase PpsR (kinase-PPPase family) [Gammaproteobacteria bacterium]|jgi:regulator of PEP synthase PpsR (kinase-PPPase family)